MQDIALLLEDVVAVLQSCPLIISEAGSANAIVAYLDLTTSQQNSLVRNIYTQPNGSVLVAWQSSDIVEGDMEGWGHQLDIYVRARRQRSPLPLLNAIIDGVPEGTSLRWRYGCVNDLTLPVEIQEIVRVQDEEGIDYYVIRTLFREKGDEAYGVPG